MVVAAIVAKGERRSEACYRFRSRIFAAGGCVTDLKGHTDGVGS